MRIFGVLSVAAMMLAGGCKKAPPPVAAKEATEAAPATATAKAATAPQEVQKLFGRWVRSDGGYVLELRQADMSGTLEAAYFNPKSIRVSRAIWMRSPQGVQVVVELNDVGYPGATYELTHDTASDRLVGRYTQPQLQQSFEIDFVRQAKP